MTTIACSRQEMAADSCYTFDDIGIGTGQAVSPKLHRIGSSVFGMRGENCIGQYATLDWIRRGAKWNKRPDIPKGASWNLLELAPTGIYLWSQMLEREELRESNFAIGSGAKAALYCMRVLQMTPRKAVEEAAKVDAFTKAPFYVERVCARK